MVGGDEKQYQARAWIGRCSVSQPPFSHCLSLFFLGSLNLIGAMMPQLDGCGPGMLSKQVVMSQVSIV
jgi:hypothetical protein